MIVPYQDGPYLIRGPVILRDQNGRLIEANRRVIALCRCGKSRTRPFCDGTHHSVRFRATSAPERSSGGSSSATTLERPPGGSSSAPAGPESGR